MEIQKAKSVAGRMRKMIIKSPVMVWRSLTGIFYDEAANAREEERINEIFKKILDHGLLTEDRKYIPLGPALCTKLPTPYNPLKK